LNFSIPSGGDFPAAESVVGRLRALVCRGRLR
jgi:hypothetical protein